MEFSKRGDGGVTGLLGGRRESKAGPRPEVCGTLDEAASALGMAKASAAKSETREILSAIQRDLLLLGAELAVAPADLEKFPPRMTAEHVRHCEKLILRLQEKLEIPKEFILAGGSLSGAGIDLGRAIVRRAERRAVALFEKKELKNPEILRFLNRLADLLFVLARFEEAR